MLNLIKSKIFSSVLSSVSEDKIAEIIEDFGKRQFGRQVDYYLDDIQKKLARIVVAINKRRSK